MSLDDTLTKLLNLLDSVNVVLRSEACSAIVHSVQVGNYSLALVCSRLLESNKKSDLNYHSAVAHILSNAFYQQLLKEVDSLVKPAKDVDQLNFDLAYVLRTKPLLFGSENNDESYQQNGSSGAKNQRAQIEASLGLSTLGPVSDTQSLFSDEDLTCGSSQTEIEPTAKKCKLQNQSGLSTTDSADKYLENLRKLGVDMDMDTVLQNVVHILCHQLHQSKWQLRHFGATCIGAIAEKLRVLRPEAFYCCLDVLLECLALDRFNDYSSCVTVAPVRIAAAKAVSSIYFSCGSEIKAGLVKALNTFLACDVWEVQQSALLVVKNLFTTCVEGQCREELEMLVDVYYEPLINCLHSKFDDVAACAAHALLPMHDVQSLVHRSYTQTQTLLTCCWNILEKMAFSGDESCSLAILQLLGFYSNRVPIDMSRVQLLIQIVKEHSSSLVRKQAFVCLSRLWSRDTGVKYSEWPTNALESLMTALFHRCVIDDPHSHLPEKILDNVPLIINFVGNDVFVECICNNVGLWLAYLMVPDSAPYLDPENLVDMNGDATPGKNRVYLCGPEVMALPDGQREEASRKVKMRLAKFLAPVFDAIAMCTKPRLEDQSPAESLNLLLLLHLQSKSYLQQTAALLCLIMWSMMQPKAGQCKEEALQGKYKGSVLSAEIRDYLKGALVSSIPPFEENLRSLSELNRLASDFLAELSYPSNSAENVSLLQIGTVCQRAYEGFLLNLDPHGRTALEAKWRSVHMQMTNLVALLSCTYRHYKLYVAVACICWNMSVAKASPLIQPLMDCVKEEQSIQIMTIVSSAFPLLINNCAGRNPCPNSKLTKNLVTFNEHDLVPTGTWHIQPNDIVTLGLQEEIIVEDLPKTVVNSGMTLERLVQEANTGIVEQLPVIWGALLRIGDPQCEQEELLCSLQLVNCVCAQIHPSLLKPYMEEKCPLLVSLLGNANPMVRYRTASCLVSMAECNFVLVMNLCLPWCLFNVSKIRSPLARAGVVEFWFLLVNKFQTKMIGLCTVLCPSVLSRMSDPEPPIRAVACQLFPMLVQLLPLEKSATKATTIEGLSEELVKIREENTDFLAMLTDPSKLSEHVFTGTSVSVELRPYQKEGITWLVFLGKYNLHGILADEMGLGKTLQTLCAVSSAYANTKHDKPARSLIVCPKTLTAHWMNEIEKYFGSQKDSNLNAAWFNPEHGFDVMCDECNVVVTSYDVIRKHTSSFNKQYWFYCILDEGHVIRNRKTQLYQAIISIKAEHRLILTGTPVQNCVLELWSLFEFLLPGYLGSASAFHCAFAKPIVASRDAKSNEHVADKGQKAMQILHKRVLPFVLRRQKCDVLKDLPDKIIQDYPCNLTSLQKVLYESVSKWCMDRNRSTNEVGKKGCILKSLTYMRKLCDHPCLVFDDDISDRQTALEVVKKEGNRDIRDFSWSGKFVALQEILLECNVGVQGNSGDFIEETYADRHRVLIFCQFTKVVDLLESYMRKEVFGKLKWLRLDGTVAASQREKIANQFNIDLSIDLLLLTTHVGGLGLNLTGADVVIFIDHDWNPVRDLQAMDRAHRLGQTRTVNVYRLISTDTIEQRIMHLQKFKTHTANAIVGHDNKSIMSMATHHILTMINEKPTALQQGTSQQTQVDWDELWSELQE